MKLIIRLVLLVGSNALALWVAYKLVPGIIFTDTSYISFIKAGAMLGVINTFVAPIVRLVSFPIRLLTLGLFTVIINVAMLFLAAYFFDFFVIKGIIAGLWGVIVISLVNYLVSAIVSDDE